MKNEDCWPSILIGVLIEALVTKRTLANPLVEVLALLLTKIFLEKRLITRVAGCWQFLNKASLLIERQGIRGICFEHGIHPRWPEATGYWASTYQCYSGTVDQLEQTRTNLVICEQSSFLLCGFHPEPAWADVVWGLPALRARSDDLVLKLLCLSPLSDTWQTEAMGAVGKNSKSGQKRIKNVKLSITTTMLHLASPFGLSRTVSIQMPQVFSLLLATAKLSSMSLSCSWRHSARWPRRWSRWVGWSTWDSVCVKLWTEQVTLKWCEFTAWPQ